MQTPLLSIFIPTFDRAHLLESTLYSLAPQVRVASSDVELIVSDDGSTDNTQEVVANARVWGPIRYFGNSQNDGMARSFIRLTSELATGECAWIIGDHDLVRPDAVAKVLSVLRAQPEVDYVLLNVSTKLAKERRHLTAPLADLIFPKYFPPRPRICQIDRLSDGKNSSIQMPMSSWVPVWSTCSGWLAGEVIN